MYGRGAIIGGTTSTAAAVILPNTGANSWMITLAISVAVGLLVWGAVYVKASK